MNKTPTPKKMTLRQIRESLGMSQASVAFRLGTQQGLMSNLERKRDRRLSTIRRYVEALGGKVEVIAVFDNKRIEIVE